MAPLFGDTYHRAKAADSSEEFFKSKEAATAAASWGSTIIGSGVQTYGTAALINATGTLSYKGAAYLGSLIFFASAAPGVSIQSSVLLDSSNQLFRSSPRSLLRSALLTPSLSVSCPVSSRLSASACSSHTGAHEPTHSTKRVQ